MPSRLASCLVASVFALVVALGCGGARPIPRAQQRPEMRATEAIAAWADGLDDPADLSQEDLVGQAALLYRGLSTLNPKAGALVGGNAIRLLTNVALCSIPLISYWSRVGCMTDPQVFVPDGPVARGLVDAGVATMSDNGSYAMVPAHDVEQAFVGLATKRRASLLERGADTCRFERIAAEWHPAPLPYRHCELDGGTTDQAKALCAGNYILWNNWQGGDPRVWFARATCAGTPALFAITAHDAGAARESILFVAFGADAEAALAHARALSAAGD